MSRRTGRPTPTATRVPARSSRLWSRLAERLAERRGLTAALAPIPRSFEGLATADPLFSLPWTLLVANRCCVSLGRTSPARLAAQASAFSVAFFSRACVSFLLTPPFFPTGSEFCLQPLLFSSLSASPSPPPPLPPPPLFFLHPLCPLLFYLAPLCLSLFLLCPPLVSGSQFRPSPSPRPGRFVRLLSDAGLIRRPPTTATRRWGTRLRTLSPSSPSSDERVVDADLVCRRWPARLFPSSAPPSLRASTGTFECLAVGRHAPRRCSPLLPMLVCVKQATNDSTDPQIPLAFSLLPTLSSRSNLGRVGKGGWGGSLSAHPRVLRACCGLCRA